MTVRTRFAPSPTGSLHVGGARTALYCWLHARRHEGVFLLRIEDTDQARSTDEAAAGIIRDMRWLGLQWDEGPEAEAAGTGPYFQSQRLDLYNRHMQELLDSGAAYEAWESAEELRAERDAARAAKENFRYKRRPTTPEQIEAWRAEGRTPVIRLAAPTHAVHVHDEVLGDVHLAVEDLEDIVIRKADGFPTYHYAVVMDDHHMGVSMVLRGQEHLLNTPKHLGLYEAMGWEPPSHAHLPIIFNMSGGKMSKRDKAKAARAGARGAAKDGGHEGWGWLASTVGETEEHVHRFMKKKHDSVSLAEIIADTLSVELPLIEVMDFRKRGYLPEGLLNYLALLGWSPGGDREIMSMDEMVAEFSLERVKKTPARFDVAKLDAMNAEHIRRSSLDRLVEAQDAYLEVRPDSHFAGMAAADRRVYLEMYQQRISTFSDLETRAGFFFERPTTWQDKAVNKHLRKGGGLERLAELRGVLADAGFGVGELEAALTAWAEARELGLGKIAQPLRVALTGTGVSPGIFETLALLGKEESLARIDATLAEF